LLKAENGSVLRLGLDAVSCSLGLIANQSPGAEQRLEQYGILDLFSAVLASAAVGSSKPDPAIVGTAGAHLLMCAA
jgi:FMN phosphatase YigB (HAD superfamily)